MTAHKRLPRETTQLGAVIGGRYRITDEIGSGGFGRVFRAEHLALKRQVAVKLLSGAVGRSDDAGKRFRREASAAGRLDHPNCVDILDFAEDQDGRLYMVMELLEGEALTETIKAGPMDVERALRIARHVLAGLGHAHKQGIVHRDVKPGNVFLIREGDDDSFAKLLDFGIAKLVGAAGEEANNLTQDGFAIGSPTYMSPEQATAAVIDGRSDLYSVSVLLFEMLTGAPPFTSDDKLSLLGMHISQPAPRLAEILGHPVPDAVQALLDAGMAKKSANRIADAEEYIARIDVLLAGAPTRSPTDAPDVPGDAALTVQTVALRPPPAQPRRPAARASRVPMVMAAGALAIAIAMVIAIGASGYDRSEALAAGLEAPTQPEPDVLVIDEAPTTDTALAVIDELLANGKRREAKRRLIALQPTSTNADVSLRLGGIYIEDMWWADAFTVYRRAFELDPSTRADPAVISGAIRSLMSRRRPGLGERFLRDEIGAPALPALRDAAKTSRSQSVRRRARRLIDHLEKPPG